MSYNGFDDENLTRKNTFKVSLVKKHEQDKLISLQTNEDKEKVQYNLKSKTIINITLGMNDFS